MQTEPGLTAPAARPGPVHLTAGSEQASEVAAAWAPSAPIVTITAGQQEFEGETALQVRQPVRDLGLYARCEALFQAWPELRQAHAAHQARVREAERYYRLRLERAMDAVLTLLDEDGASPALQEHTRAAVRALRTLDRQHLRTVRALYSAFREALREPVRAALAHERQQLADALDDAQIVVIAGGHVAVLLNRLRLLDVAPLIGPRAVVAWGAGAMACTERVLLFHERGAVGPRPPQLLAAGLGLVRQTVVLPQARERLALGDANRLGALARRMAPARVVLLDQSAHLPVADGRPSLSGLHGLAASGRVVRLRS